MVAKFVKNVRVLCKVRFEGKLGVILYLVTL
jgi:hypothetical protein